MATKTAFKHLVKHPETTCLPLMYLYIYKYAFIIYFTPSCINASVKKPAEKIVQKS